MAGAGRHGSRSGRDRRLGGGGIPAGEEPAMVPLAFTMRSGLDGEEEKSEGGEDGEGWELHVGDGVIGSAVRVSVPS